MNKNRVDILVEDFCDVLYRLDIFGYDKDLGDEPIDTLVTNLINYWEITLVGRPPRL